MHVITGLGPDGRSKVIEVRDGAIEPGDFSVETLWMTDQLPPTVQKSLWAAAQPQGMSGTPKSGAQWISSWLPAGRPAELFCSPNFACDLVVFGETTLLLEDGEIVLSAGDTLVMPGIPHAWRPGPEGCRIVSFLLPLSP